MTSSDLSDDRVLFDVEPDKRIATITLNNPAQRNSYDAAMRDSVGALPRSCRRGRRSHRGPAPRSRRRVLHRCRHEQRLRLVRRARASEPNQEPSQSTPSAHGGSKVVRLLPRPDGLPEGHGGRDQRLRAGRRLRDGADDRHLGDRGAIRRSVCPRRGFSDPRWAACTCSSIASARCWHVGCC